MTAIPSRLLPQVVTVRPLTGSGGMGTTYGDPVDVPARVSLERQLVRSASGEEVVAEAVVVTRPDVSVPLGSRVKLPGDSSERTVLTAGTITGARSAHHLRFTTS